MLWVQLLQCAQYLLPCKPFFKVSVLSLQVQAGIKCSIPLYDMKGFSNWKLNINQKDISSFPFTTILDLIDGQEMLNQSVTTTLERDPDQVLTRTPLQHDRVGSIHAIEPTPENEKPVAHLQDPKHEGVLAEESRRVIRRVDRLDLSPPPAPQGYVLYRDWLKLKPSAWLPGHVFPTFYMIDGWRYAREDDVLIPSATANKPKPSARMYPRPSEAEAPLATVIHQANVGQYVYTGNTEMDLAALRTYLDRFDKAIKTLDMHVPAREASKVDNWKAKQHIRRARDDLQEEIQAVVKEINDPNESGYTGFDEFDLGMPPIPKKRPRGYVWKCRM